MDLLESGGERERTPLADRLRVLMAVRLPGPAVGAIACASMIVLVAGLLVGARQAADQASRVDVDLQVVDSTSSTVGGVARGVLELLLVNRRSVPVEVGGLRVEVEGLRVLSLEPERSGPLQPLEQRPVRVRFLVPSCSALVLPGSVSLSLRVAGRDPVRRDLRVYDPREDPAGDGIRFAACPPSARTARPGTSTDLGARPAGGTVRQVGPGAEGSARIEIRNAGTAVRLLSVDARVPGVEFTPRVLAGGRTLETDGLVLVSLRFRVPDCAKLQKTGWLVLRVERFGGVQELGLRLTAEPAGGLGPQAPLPVVLDACD